MALFKNKNLSKPLRKKQNRLDGQNTSATGKSWTLRQKIVLVVAATLIGLLAILYAASSMLLLTNIKVAEKQNTRQVVESVLSIFAQTKADFSARFADWSSWDDTYNFIEQGNSSYSESNLNQETLASMRVNLVLYIDASGRLVYGTGVDTERRKKIPVPSWVEKHIAKGSLLLRSADKPDILTGILPHSSGPMLVTSQPILTSRRTGPMRGSLMFGRYLDTAKIQKLASRYRLTWHEINSSQLPPDFLTARSYLLSEWQNSSGNAQCSMPNAQCPMLVSPLDRKAMAGYTIIDDIYGKPALLLRVETSRDIYRQGIANLHYLFACLAIVGLVFGAIATLLTEKLLNTQHQRQESEIRYRAVIAQATDGIFFIDAHTKRFLEANAALEKLLGYTLKELLQLTLYDVLLEQPEKIDQDLQQILTAEQHFTGEQQYRCFDGSILQVEVKANQIAHPKKAILCVVLRDISARKQAENAKIRQSQKEQAVNRVVQSLRNSLELNTIFSTAVSEIGTLLKVERATIIEYFPDAQIWRCVAEYRQTPDLPIGLGLEIPDCNNWVNQRVKQLEIIRIDDINQIEDEIVKNLAPTYPGAWLIIPLRVESYNSYETLSIPVWGTLNLLRHSAPTPWEDWEVELASAIADQLAIAIQQSKLYQQIQQLNADLENQVIERTAELEKALGYEATLKRITDKVRDSLDESQILQTAVEELAISLGVYSCDAALYDLERRTSTICYEYICPEIPSAKGLTLQIDDWPDIYEQLLHGQYVQYCFYALPAALVRRSKLEFTILCCPLTDDRGVLGDMWLFKARTDYFSDLEIRLVQQVANQCAIAIRQARLYQATQAQVEELEKLNRLKDDFLSTVSHELRTPMSNIKVATQMLEIVLKQMGALDTESTKLARYFKILHDECQRETNLINDLLDLSRLDAGAEALVLSSINPKIAILHITELFVERIHSQQQQIEIDLPAQLPNITTDLSKLERIITELLNNACKYTPAGEKITITAQVKQVNKSINDELTVSSAIPTQASLLLSVKNSGVEIPPKEVERIFDKFYRIPNSNPWKHGGTGLGLALVQKLVTYLRGSIRVESANNEICFTVELPI